MKLLFIHGAGCTGAYWRFQSTHFEGSQALSLPGHPEGEGLNRIEGYARWVKDWIEDHEYEPLVGVGHSMGGAIFQWMALNYADIFRGIVLVGTGVRLRITPQIFEALSGDYEKAVDFIFGYSFGPNPSPQLWEEMKKENLQVPVAVTRGDLEACHNFDVMGQVEAISLPTLLICGTDDRLTPVKYSQFLNSRIPNSRLELIEGAGHNVMLEKPTEFNQALEMFLAGLSP